MIIELITCDILNPHICHTTLELQYPTMISCLHIPNHHIITTESDYDKKGNLNQSVHDEAWKFGGVKKELRLKKPDGSQVWVKWDHGVSKEQVIVDNS